VPLRFARPVWAADLTPAPRKAGSPFCRRLLSTIRCLDGHALAHAAFSPPQTRCETGRIAAAMDFELVGDITVIETIAAGRGIRDLKRLRRLYGSGYWRKMKGSARIRLRNGRIRLAEIHWYEAHGIGKKEFKRKRYLD
jgi:hypothetical protein